METLFSFLVLIIQLLVVLMIGAWVGDHIIQPRLERRHGKR